jgi:hypothetical protein
MGEGARNRPGPPVHPEQVLLLSLECLHILTEHNIYIFYTERIKQIYKYIALGEEKVARRGWGAGLLPAPLKGVFCVIRALQEVSRHAILTRIGYKHI